MALVLNDRVRETTSVVGTGAVTLLGAVTGFQSFSTIGNANTTYYCISDQAGANWEVGIGTYTSAGTTLARTTVLASSNGGALVVFTAGTKDVFVTYPSERAIYGDASDLVTLANQLNLTNASDYNLYASGAGDNYMAGALGIGTTSLTARRLVVAGSVTGATGAYGVLVSLTIQPDVTANAIVTASQAATAANGGTPYTIATLTCFNAAQVAFNADSTVTSQYGFSAAANIIGAANNYSFFGNIPEGTGRYNLYMGGTADNYLAGSLGIGAVPYASVDFLVSKSVTGGATRVGVSVEGLIQSDVTALYIAQNVTLKTAAAAFTCASVQCYRVFQTPFGAGSSVTNQSGFFVDASLTSATNNYGFFGNIPAGTGRYNLYMAGTANNYMAGSLGIGGVPSADTKVEVAGTYPSSGAVSRVIRANGIIPSTTTATARLFGTESNTQAAVFNISALQHFCALQSTMGAGSTVTSQYGFLTDTAFTGATNNYGFYGAIPSGTGRYNLYMGGTADNYLAGSLGIGESAIPNTQTRLRINGGTLTNANLFVVDQQSTIPSTTTGGYTAYRSVLGSVTASYTLPQVNHFVAVQAVFGAGSTVTAQYGVNVGATLVGATNNYGFYGAIPAGTGCYNLYMAGTASNYLGGPLITAGLTATSAAAPTIASATTIAPTTQIAFVSGVVPVVTITAPSPISLGGGQITLIPTGIFTTTTAGNIALASTAIVGKALIMTYDATTTKWYPSY